MSVQALNFKMSAIVTWTSYLNSFHQVTPTSHLHLYYPVSARKSWKSETREP